MRHNLYVDGRALELQADDGDDPEDKRRNFDLVLAHPTLLERAAAFVRATPVPVAHSAASKVLCVLQREYGAVRADKVRLLGTDDATTCLMLFLRLGPAVCCGHLDNLVAIGNEKCGVVSMYNALVDAAAPDVADSAAEVHAWIAGGFMDETGYSAATLGMVLAALNALPRRVELELVCAERLNDRVIDGVHYPVHMGAVFDTAAGTLSPAHWTHLGPAVGLRAVLPCCGEERMFSCYDWRRDRIRIHFPYGDFELAQELLAAPDEFLLHNVSTSGKQEPARFLSTLRAALGFLVQHPDCAEVFAKGPVCFSRSELGAWVLEK